MAAGMGRHWGLDLSYDREGSTAAVRGRLGKWQRKPLNEVQTVGLL
jgi:hypothetical protein